MKKTNKKGFTLVELLAVIVILGVLLMIAVPAIQNVIKSSRKKAFDSAIKLTIENIETLASTAVDSSITPCYVTFGDKAKLGSHESEITLERGSYGSNTFGIVVVNAKGKGTAYANGENGTYYVTGNTINNVVSVNKVSDSDANNYKEITSLITAYAKGTDGKALGKCSAQNWWS